MKYRCFLSLPLAGLLCTNLLAETVAGRVVGVPDGDTLTVADTAGRQHKIRLAGIDAPERLQPFGERARTSLGALALNREIQADCRKRDRYGTPLCTVLVGGRDIGLEQVAAGMAWWDREQAATQPPQARSDYEGAEFWAKARRLGLWADKNPVPPWDWRR